MQVRKTATARRYVGLVVGLEGGVRGVARGKKRRKRRSLDCQLISPPYFAHVVHLISDGHINSHDSKTSPLHPHLRNTQHSRCAIKATQLSTAGQVSATGRQREYIGESAGAGRGAQEDEVGGYAFGGAPGDDTVVLGEVGY